MSGTTNPPSATGAAPAPLKAGDALSVWVATAVEAQRGDVSVVRAEGDIPARVAVFKYRGAEPIPRFLEHLKADGDRWKAVRHPSLMPTLETGRLPSSVVCYWAQEDVPGQILAERIAAHAPFSPQHALAIARQVGTALTVVHRAELVHGDISAENVVMLDGRERLRLAWGGVASRLEAAGMNVGRRSSAWAELSPETMLEMSPTTHTDVYGLSALLYRMLTGQPAYTPRKGGPPHGVTPAEPLPPLPGWVPRALLQLLSDGLSSEPRERPDLYEVLDRLDDLENAMRGARDPIGTWSPNQANQEPSNTPPTVNRTIEPRDDPDRDSDTNQTIVTLEPPPPVPPPRPPPPPPGGVRGGMASAPPIPLDRDPVLVNERPSAPPLPRRPSIPAVPPPRPWNPIALGGAAIVGLALLVLLVVIVQPRRGPAAADASEAAEVAAAPGPAPAAPTAPGIAPPPTRAGPAILTLTSDPPSAEAWEGTQFLGLTPVDVTLEGGRTREFELKLAGYLPSKVSQPASEVDVRHSVVLRPLPRREPEPPKVVPAVPAPALKGNR